MKVEMIFFRGGKHDYSWTWGARNFYGFIEYYYSGLGQNDYKEAIVDPEIIKRLPG